MTRTNDLDRDVAIRLTRQDIIGDGPELNFILDEAVLHRIIGSPEIMRTQLRWLIEQQRQPNVTIQVLPFSVGVHKGMKDSFTILDLSDDDDDYALLLEQSYEDRLIEDTSDETREYVQIFAELTQLALSPEGSVALVERVIAALGEGS